ncbi:unnamed protein product, partial [Timema podura]|nr:unnamed protein product [Timema podura]
MVGLYLVMAVLAAMTQLSTQRHNLLIRVQGDPRFDEDFRCDPQFSVIISSLESKGTLELMRVFVVILSLASASSHHDPLTVSVYYSTMCGDTIRFFREQFLPAWNQLEGQFSAQLVPYGKSN